MYAAGKGHTEIADLLVRSNADVNVKDNVRTNTIYCIYTIDYWHCTYIRIDIVRIYSPDEGSVVWAYRNSGPIG